jgi:hypothetical protein
VTGVQTCALPIYPTNDDELINKKGSVVEIKGEEG